MTTQAWNLELGAWNLELSWCQPLPSPRTVAALHVSQPIVQAALAPLPELELVGDDAIAAPPVGTRHGAVPVGALDAIEDVLEHLAALDRFALLRSIDAQTAVERTRREVRVRLGGTDALDGSVDPHLTLERAPEEQRAGAPRRLHVVRLPALVVRVEDESPIVNALVL